MLGAIIQNTPHPLAGLGQILSGVAEGFDKRDRRRGLHPSTTELPLDAAERVTAQLASTQAQYEQTQKNQPYKAMLDRERNLRFLQMLGGVGGGNQTGQAEVGSAEWRMAMGLPRAPKKPKMGRGKMRDVRWKNDFGEPTTARVPEQFVNVVNESISNFGTGSPTELWGQHVNRLEQDNFASFANIEESADALQDFVRLSVILKKGDPQKAIDRYFDLWDKERKKRGFWRDDIISNLPEGHAILRLKLNAMIEYLDNETADEVAMIISNYDGQDPDEKDSTALKSAWEKLKGTWEGLESYTLEKRREEWQREQDAQNEWEAQDGR